MSTSSVAQQASMFLEVNRPNDAIRVLVPEVTSNPDNAACLMLLARAYLDVDPTAIGARHALPAIEHAISLLPDDSAAWQILAEVNSRLGAHPRARKAARTALRLAPTVQANIVLAHADVAAKKVNRRTHAAVAEAIRLAPDRPETHFTAGYVSHNTDHPGRAAKHYRRALAIDPNYRPAIDNLAIIQAGQGDLGRAIAAYVGILSSDPNYQRAAKVLRSITRVYLGVADLMLAFLVVLIGISFRSVNNQLQQITPGYASPGMTLRAIAAAIAILGALAFFLTVRRRAGAHFSRYLKSLPSIAMRYVVWAIGLGACILAMIVAIFVGSVVAVRTYEITFGALVAGFLIGNITGRDR